MFDYCIEGDLVEENYTLTGEIISQFDHVINIKTAQNNGFAIIDSKVIMAPYHIQVPDYIFQQIAEHVKENSTIKIFENKIKYGNRTFSYKEKEIYKGIINSHSDKKKDQIINWTEKVIKNTKKLGSLDKTILNYKEIINNLDEFNLTPLQREFYKNLKKILAGECSIEKLLGLGIGLTPTGDDFIVGYLSALEAEVIKDKLDVVDNLKLSDIFARTTRVSALHLKAALNHRFNKKLVDIYKNLSGEEKEYIKNTKKLLKVGNSSGLDMLSGLYFGLVI